MKAFEPSLRRAHRGFTLVELLTVIGLIILIAALAVPNFSAMMREQRWNSAISALQTAIMRARIYATTQNLDHAVEICTDSAGTTYLRIEAESAFLESIPNLQDYMDVVDSFLYVPDTWTAAFLARRDAWGSDGRRLYSGMINVRWLRSGGSYGAGWGHACHNLWRGAYYGMGNLARFYYDDRYRPKSELPWPWLYPADNEGRALSIDERTNLAGDHGYQDVNDSNPFSANWGSVEVALNVSDNLAVDDFLYLPHDITVDLDRSTLINFDADVVSGRDILHHGWDGTYDIRFGKDGHLIQVQTLRIVLARKDGQVVRLSLLRGTGRLKRIF